MKTLADNVELDGSFTPEDVRDMLVEAVNLAWSQNGNNARCTVTANFIAWILLENDRLRACVAQLEGQLRDMRILGGKTLAERNDALNRVAELEAENTQLRLCLRDNGSTKPLLAKGRTKG